MRGQGGSRNDSSRHYCPSDDDDDDDDDDDADADAR